MTSWRICVILPFLAKSHFPSSSMSSMTHCPFSLIRKTRSFHRRTSCLPGSRSWYASSTRNEPPSGVIAPNESAPSNRETNSEPSIMGGTGSREAAAYFFSASMPCASRERSPEEIYGGHPLPVPGIGDAHRVAGCYDRVKRGYVSPVFRFVSPSEPGHEHAARRPITIRKRGSLLLRGLIVMTQFSMQFQCVSISFKRASLMNPDP